MAFLLLQCGFLGMFFRCTFLCFQTVVNNTVCSLQLLLMQRNELVNSHFPHSEMFDVLELQNPTKQAVGTYLSNYQILRILSIK